MQFLSNGTRALLAALLLGLFANTAAAAEDDVVATVNGKPITQEQLTEYRSARADSAKVQDDKNLTDELITREVVIQEALRRNLDQDPQVLKELEQLRTRVLVSAVISRALEENPVTEDELRADYDSLKSRLVSTEYKASHILVDDEAQAKGLIAQLDEGADFADLAREHSTGPTGKKGGDLGWLNPQQMAPAFSRALQQLEKDSYSKTPVKTRFGWHIIRLGDTRQAEPPSFEEVKGRLEKMVRQRHVGQYIQELKDQAEISVKD